VQCLGQFAPVDETRVKDLLVAQSCHGPQLCHAELKQGRTDQASEVADRRRPGGRLGIVLVN
jgi:hypothetical protein